MKYKCFTLTLLIILAGCSINNKPTPEPSLRKIMIDGVEARQAISYVDDSLEATYHAYFAIKDKRIFNSGNELAWVMPHQAIMVKKDSYVNFKVYYSTDGTENNVSNEILPLEFSYQLNYSGLEKENIHLCDDIGTYTTDLIKFDIHQETNSGFQAFRFVKGIGEVNIFQKASIKIDLLKIKEHAGNKFNDYIPIIVVDCVLSSCFEWSWTEGWTIEKGPYAPFSEWLFYKGEIDDFKDFKNYLNDLSVAKLHLTKMVDEVEKCSGLVAYGHQVFPIWQL